MVSVPLPAPPFPGAGRAQTAIMIVPHGIKRPLSSCLFNARAHTGIKSISREHEGALTKTEPAIIMQTPLSAKPWFSPVAGVSVLGGHHWANAAPPFG